MSTGLFWKLIFQGGAMPLLAMAPGAAAVADEPLGAFPSRVTGVGTFPRYITESVIESTALHRVHGAISINLAAGDGNAQVNLTGIALNPEGVAAARVGIEQSTDLFLVTPVDVAIARIDAGAFADAAGLISLNQSSGAGNAQANAVAIAMGVEGEAVADIVLAETRVGVAAQPPQDEEEARPPAHSATMDEAAFANAAGIIQVNQSAGTANATGNSFGLQILLDASP
ncbi:MAG: hypothetical protein M3Z21_16840 [Pseudomonadota bacterium]|nr:hypothetical protein [Pseudomonadota bacterium]